MDCAGFNAEIYDLYTLGILEGEEEIALQDHLERSCEACQLGLQESLGRTARMSLAVPTVAPPGDLRGRITGMVRPAGKDVPKWWSAAWSGWVAAACVALGATAIVYVQSSRVSRAPVVISRVGAPAEALPPAPPHLQPAPPSTRADAKSAVELERVRQQAVALAADVSQERSRIAQLEADLRAKDSELASTQQQRDAVQAKLATASAPAAPDRADPRMEDLQRQLETLTRQVRFYQTAIQAQRADLERGTRLISFLSAPNLRVLELQATEQGGAAFGRALMAGSGSMLFYASQLPPLPSGRTYQLWIMRNRGRAVTSGGVFQPDTNHAATLTVPNAAGVNGITALAITEEPAGGVPLPTGHKVLIGALKT